MNIANRSHSLCKFTFLFRINNTATKCTTYVFYCIETNILIPFYLLALKLCKTNHCQSRVKIIKYRSVQELRS